MKRTTIAVSAAVVLAGAAGLWYYLRADARDTVTYRFTTIERGNLRSTVSSTGTLGAIRTVAVGTQVSGQIAAIHADFNDRVVKGQLIAQIDSTLQLQAVEDARAGVERADAQLAQAQLEYGRASVLREQKVITEAEFNVAQTANVVAKANRTSAGITLARATQNLAYTNIYAPISGVVVERNVDVGQTVAASLQAPQLFLIANDLTQMQILATVDEADIGKIHEGQRVTFTVQAFQNDVFSGTVRQVRLGATTQSNVVNYTAVIAVANQDRKLLPGMTATTKFVTGSVDSVLTVANAALRFKPATAATSAATTPAGAVGATTLPGARGGLDAPVPVTVPAAGTGAGGRAGASPSGRATGAGAAVRAMAAAGTLWTMGPDGTPVALRVRIGISDGTRTQVEGEGVTEGLQVILASSSGTTAGATKTTNPFQAQSQGPGGGRGPGPY